MEPQEQPTERKPQMVAVPAKKCKHLPVIIVLAILAAGGLGFGGYELWQNMQKDEEIKNLQAEKVESENQKEDEEGEDTSELTENSSEYIYVSEFGIKIKKPENSKEIIRGYEFINGFPMAIDEFNIIYYDKAAQRDVRIGIFEVSQADYNRMCGEVFCVKIDDRIFSVSVTGGEWPNEISVPEELKKSLFTENNYSKI